MRRSPQTTRKLYPVGDVEVLAQWAFTRVGATLVLVASGEQQPPETDVDAWMIRMARGDCRNVLLHARGGVPDSRQRARLAAFWDKLPEPRPRFAMLTDSAFIRAAATALGWISQMKIEPFPITGLADALRYLGEVEKLETVRDTLSLLNRALDAVALAQEAP